MSKNESVKASLDLYKGLIYLIITGIFAVCGFFANNYKTAESVTQVPHVFGMQTEGWLLTCGTQIGNTTRCIIS